MELSFLSFSIMGEAAHGSLDADTLCAIAGENGIRYLDLKDTEVARLG